MMEQLAETNLPRSMGFEVFSGMIGVTVFGLFFTPVFYLVLASERKGSRHPSDGGVKV